MKHFSGAMNFIAEKNIENSMKAQEEERQRKNNPEVIELTKVIEYFKQKKMEILTSYIKAQQPIKGNDCLMSHQNDMWVNIEKEFVVVPWYEKNIEKLKTTIKHHPDLNMFFDPPPRDPF